MGDDADFKRQLLEAEIAAHRPRPEVEDLPASAGKLWQLNKHGLLWDAVQAQVEKDQPLNPEFAVVTNLTAWETAAAAQRRGVVFEPRSRN